MPASSKIIELRELLAAKHPDSRPKATGCLPTGLARVDDALHGGLPLGAMTEIVCPRGGGLLLSALLLSVLENRRLMALVDASNSFDSNGVPAAALARLLLVRRCSAAKAMQVTDLLLRDGNLSLVVVDLRSCRAEETQKIPSSSWYRLQRVVEPASTALVVLTRQPLVCAARPRLTLETRFTLNAFERRQTDLMSRLEVAFVRGAAEAERERQYA